MMNFDMKQFTGQLFLNMGVLGSVLVPTTSVLFPEISSVIQPMPRELTIVNNAKEINSKQEEFTPGMFARYDSAKFSVDYPRGWQVDSLGEGGVAITGIADDVNMPIRTEIAILREDPNTVVPQRLERIVANSVSVGRYSLVTIDRQSGFRIWYEPAMERRALVTFVGYGNQQTAILTSRYAPNPEAEAIVIQMHGSFVNHSVAQAVSP